MHPPVLIVLHNEHSTPGRVGNALRDLGYPLDIRRPRFGDTLPETMAGHSAAVIFGGPMSANDTDDFVRREIEWIGVPVKNVTKTPLVAGQWQKGEKGFELVVTTNSHAPEIPVTGELKLL